MEENDNCTLAKKRAQTKKEKDEDATEAVKEREATLEIAKREEEGITPRERMADWLAKTMSSFHLDTNSPNLLNTHQECKLTLTLSKESYSRWMSKFFKLQSLFNSYCVLAALNMTSHDIE